MREARRKPVTPTRIFETSAAIADTIGLDQMTMAAIAAQLGISVPGLYKHVDNLQSVRRGLSLLGIEDLTERIIQATVGKAGPSAIHATANAYRAYAHDHPGTYAASVIAPETGDAIHTAASDRLVQIVFAVMVDYAFNETDAIDAVRFLRAIMHGFVSLEATDGFGLPQSIDASFARMIDTFVLGLACWANQQDRV